VEVVLTEQFEQAHEKLTKAEKRSVRKALTLLGDNPKHPSLRVKKMEGRRNIWEARPSKRLRMTFEMAGEIILMRNVGEHDKVLRRP
jgi:mRNA-degrading endonuclease RelE of RelBE toxin-antitoxin system